MDILIVDDNNDKIANLVTVVRRLSEDINVLTAIDSISAQKLLSETKFDLLILDLLLPLRRDDQPEPVGGRNLVREIERNPQLKSPNYIVGITQYEEHINVFSPIWNVLYYSPSCSKWEDQLTQLFSHIVKSKKSQPTNPKGKKPTIFFEGVCDHLIFSEAIKLFAPHLESRIILKSEKGSGASWVGRQIIIWASTLAKDGDSYLKAIGILDGDQAGLMAKDEVNRVVHSSSAGRNSFKILQLSPSYARDLIPLFAKGLIIPITLEEMIPSAYWQIAQSNGWLQNRNEPDSFLKDPKKWDKMNVTLKDHIASLGLSETEIIYLKKFKTENKEDFAKFILSLDFEKRKEALRNFEPVIVEIKNFFF